MDVKKIKKRISNEKIVLDNKNENNAAFQINFKGFEYAIAAYTPITKRIHSISTAKKVENCHEEPTIIAGVLEKKFGENIIKKGMTLKDVYYIGKHPIGQKGIILTCSYNLKELASFIQITASDLDVIADNEKELIEISAKEELDKL